jgi:hypothetical protein
MELRCSWREESFFGADRMALRTCWAVSWVERWEFGVERSEIFSFLPMVDEALRAKMQLMRREVIEDIVGDG